MAKPERTLKEIYRRLDRHYGDQEWWPGETPLEVAAGAILTQNTAWTNVVRALAKVKRAGVMDAARLAALRPSRLAALIRPSGCYNVKARRLKAFMKMLAVDYGGDMKALAADPSPALREKLLGIHGVGPETADSILLYACGRPTFVVDAYTRRVLSRHGLVAAAAPYDELKALFEDNLPADAALFNQYHALLVKVGKDRCRPRAPRCAGCPLEPMLGKDKDARRRPTT